MASVPVLHVRRFSEGSDNRSMGRRLKGDDDSVISLDLMPRPIINTAAARWTSGLAIGYVTLRSPMWALIWVLFIRRWL